MDTLCHTKATWRIGDRLAVNIWKMKDKGCIDCQHGQLLDGGQVDCQHGGDVGWGTD